MRISARLCMLLMGLMAIPLAAVNALATDSERFRPPFDSTQTVDMRRPLSLSNVLALVARSNPTFRALELQKTAAEHRLDQAGLWLNPEFESVFENISWDAKGFEESEITLVLSQEFQIFGQRGARKQFAQAGIDAVSLNTRIAAFDLFLDVKTRFYALAHAQKRVVLSDSSVALADGILSNISSRMERGAALQSEQLLARLESQRAELARDAAKQDLVAAQAELSALWSGDSTDLAVTASEEPELEEAVTRLNSLILEVDSSRAALQSYRQTALVRAENQLAAAEARPGITISGGYKRLEELGINSLVFGVSLPLPLFNRNQGTRASLESQLRSLEYEQQRVRLETLASIRSGAALLVQLLNRHMVLDTTLLPTAEDAYETLQQAYKAGRLPYTSLLEAERTLIGLRFEHNDVLLSIHERLIALERISGVRLQNDFE